jgi:3-hydroxyacyl-CoA dehydrogenase
MGHGIAQVFAQHEFAVTLVDNDDHRLKEALSRIKNNLATLVDYGLLERDATADILSRITPTVDLRLAVQHAQFVTEAVPEDLDLKRTIFKSLGDNAPSDAILASNTSGLDIDSIASSTSRPESVIGTNWWNPPHIIPLVEIMLGRKTSHNTRIRTTEILERVGKKPVTLLRPIQGFIGNRLQIALLREALSLLDQGVAKPEDIDRAVKYGLGFRWAAYGPLEVADFGGLDVFRTLGQDLYHTLDASEEVGGTLAELVSGGYHGIKTGRGFYDYTNKETASLLAERDRKLLGILRLKL